LVLEFCLVQWASKGAARLFKRLSSSPLNFFPLFIRTPSGGTERGLRGPPCFSSNSLRYLLRNLGVFLCCDGSPEEGARWWGGVVWGLGGLGHSPAPTKGFFPNGWYGGPFLQNVRASSLSAWGKPPNTHLRSAIFLFGRGTRSLFHPMLSTQPCGQVEPILCSEVEEGSLGEEPQTEYSFFLSTPLSGAFLVFLGRKGTNLSSKPPVPLLENGSLVTAVLLLLAENSRGTCCEVIKESPGRQTPTRFPFGLFSGEVKK